MTTRPSPSGEEITQLLEDFGDNQIQSTLELEAYEAQWKRAEQEPAIELETILIDNESSEHSADGNENVNHVPPHDAEKTDEQLPKNLPEESPQPEQPPNPAQTLTKQTPHESARPEEPINKTLQPSY